MNDNYCPVCKSAPLITDYCPNCSRLGNSSGIMEDEIEGLRSALGNAGLIIESLRQQLTSATQALELIAAPKRKDGTYNRCREACEVIAREALAAFDEFN